MPELFRDEAVRNAQLMQTGQVFLVSPLSQKIWTALVVGLTASILIWLCFAEYTRREKVSGHLVSTDGLVEITASSAARVESIPVKDGQYVHKGDILAVLSSERYSQAIGDTNSAIIGYLDSQKSRLDDDIDAGKALQRKQESALRQQLVAIAGAVDSLESQIAVARRQKDSASVLFEKMKPLMGQGYVSAQQIQEQESRVLDAESQIEGLTKQIYDESQQRRGLEGQLAELGPSTEAKQNELKRQRSKIDQTLAETEVDHAQLVRAPVDGVVSSVLIRPGRTVVAGELAMTVLSQSSPLQAELLVPSKAMGFLRKGTPVALHYEAFPFQKFGIARGVVVELARTALRPAEVGELLGSQPPAESMYRIMIDLDSQAVMAYGKREPLRPGMTVQADLLVDSRTLGEWLFEPLYAWSRDR
jgi:membrane fusion protein